MTLSLASGGLSWLDKGGLAGLRRGRTTGRRTGVDPEDYAMRMRDLADRNAENIAQRNAGGNVVYSGVPGQFRRTPGGPSPITQDQILATARTAAVGAQLGTPESYGGQGPLTVGDVTKARQQGQVMGAEGQPIEVIRRLGVTHQGPSTGEEYGTVGQARQAMRRDIGVGEYVSPDMNKAAGKFDPNQAKFSLEEFDRGVKESTAVVSYEDPSTGAVRMPPVIENKVGSYRGKITEPGHTSAALDDVRNTVAEYNTLSSKGGLAKIMANLGVDDEGNPRIVPPEYKAQLGNPRLWGEKEFAVAKKLYYRETPGAATQQPGATPAPSGIPGIKVDTVEDIRKLSPQQRMAIRERRLRPEIPEGSQFAPFEAMPGVTPEEFQRRGIEAWKERDLEELRKDLEFLKSKP